MSYDNVEVKITVKVDGKRVGRRRVVIDGVATLDEGRDLLRVTHGAVDDLARELRAKAGV